MGAKAKNFYVELADLYGYGDSARECQDLFLAGDRLGAANALTDELIDVGAIATTDGLLADRMAAYAEIGVNELVAVPCGDTVAKERTVRALAAASVPA